MSPNAGGGEVAGSQSMSKAVMEPKETLEIIEGIPPTSLKRVSSLPLPVALIATGKYFVENTMNALLCGNKNYQKTNIGRSKMKKKIVREIYGKSELKENIEKAEEFDEVKSRQLKVHELFFS
jgi:hypothetical protein